MRRHGGRRGGLLPLVAAVVVLSGCQPAAWQQASGQGSPLAAAVTVGPSSTVVVPVAGPAADRMTVTVQPGDFRGDGSVGSLPSTEQPPRMAGFTAAGAVREVRVTGSLAAPVTVSFAAGPQHAGDVPVVWRKDPTGGWYPVAVGDAGGTASAERTAFSPHLPGWLDPGTWLAKGWQWARGRTDPPTCGSAPAWASLTQPALDQLRTCVQTNTAGGVTRVELKLKNNRAQTQEVTVPPGVAYADVEGQSDGVRALVRTLGGGKDIVVLPPGDELRIGFTQPSAATTVTVTPTVNALSLMADLAVNLADLAQETGSMAVLPALLNVSGCAGFKAEVVAGAIPDSFTAVKNLIQGLLKCASALAEGGAAAAVARAVVAAKNNITEAVAESDKKYAGKLDKLAGKLKLFGKLAGAYNLAELARAAASIWESDAENFGRARASYDPAVVTLGLKAAQVPRPVATDSAFGPVRLGMTPAQAAAVAGVTPKDDGGHCTYVEYSVPGAPGKATAIIHDAEGVVIAIETPNGTKTDRGVGDGSTVAQARAAYGKDRNIEQQETQAGQALLVTTGNPDDAGFGNPGKLIGFAVGDDGTLGPPEVGGVPGYEYCSG